MEQVCAPFWSEGEIERTPDRRDTRFGERVDQDPPLSDQRIYFRYLSDPRKSRVRDTVSQSVSYFTVPPQIETRESFPKHVSVQSCTLVIANKPNAMRRQMMRSSRGADPRRHILEPRVDSTRAASKQPMQKREAPLRGGKLEAIERPRLHLHVLRSSGKKTPGGAGTQRHTRDTPGIKRPRGDLPF